jgi:hypothetical protein
VVGEKKQRVEKKVTGREVSVDEKEEQRYRVNMPNKMIRSCC